MEEINLSVVIPAYNEEKNLEREVLDQVRKYLENLGLLYEVIIVNDGSTDTTAQLIKQQIKDKKGFQLIENKHGGKAITVITGVLASKGEMVLFADLDQATPISEVEKFLPKFEEGFDIVIGSRKGRKGASAMRKLTARGFAFLRGIILGLPFKDTQCGFKAFSREAQQKIFPIIKNEWGVLHTKGGAVNAGFDVEVLFVAKKLGFKIAEVEVEWLHPGTSQVRVIKDSLAAIYDMFRIRVNDFKGKYG